VPVGVVGELYIAGDGLARGYAQQPALTAERFLPNPFGAPGSRMYRTGDFARRRRDGLIEFAGRLDDQVKIRGYRIELGEIENVLREHATVREAAVLVRDDMPIGRTLVAYVVAAGGGILDVDALREHLRATLPVYMIPARFVLMDSLPLSPTGKVSRRHLPAPSGDESQAEALYVAPSNDVEETLAGIWGEVLQLERISADDNFFDLGGHSLLATRIVSRIREQLPIELPLRTLFEYPTVRGLAARVTEQAGNQIRDHIAAATWRYLFRLKGDGGTPIFFLPGGHGGDYEFLVYARLVHFVGDGFTFYGLRARSADGIEPAHPTVEEMARDYITEIRSVQATGPYRLVGNCIGGVVAYEVARQLESTGQEVRTLVLMDTDFPAPERYAQDIRDRGGQLSLSLKARFYASRFSHHWRALRSMPRSERRSYLLGRVRRVTRNAPEQAASSLDPAERVKMSYVETLRRYEPKPYRGRVSIIASQHDDSDPARSWGRTIRGPIAVHMVQGDHESYIRDFVREAAAKLEMCLTE